MVGIVLITHAKLAKALLSSLIDIVGDIEGVQAVSIEEHYDENKIRTLLSKAIDNVNQGDGVIILTDMFGGTPSNMALSFLKNEEIEIITGVNLPMLIKAAGVREGKKLSEFAGTLKDKGQESIVLASEMLKGDS